METKPLTTTEGAGMMMKRICCADCGSVIATYNSFNEADKKRADAVSHSCKQQRARNRKAGHTI